MPYDHLKRHLEQYPNAEVVWVQEEHKNMGAWSFVQPRFNSLFKKLGRKGAISYAGRGPNCSPATGFPSTHKTEFEQMMNEALA